MVNPNPRPRDDTDAVKDIARDLADVAAQIATFKGEANAYLGDPSYNALRHRLEVAHAAVKQARRYINSNAAVGEHLADQLLLPLAIGEGGSFTTTPLSGHSLTNIETIRRFVDREIATEQLSNGVVRVSVR